MTATWVDFFIMAGGVCADCRQRVDLGLLFSQAETQAPAQAPPSARATRCQSHARPDRRAAAPAPAGAAPRDAFANAITAMHHSRAITRKSASNLALAFVLLPRAKRDAMSALYAFCREVDDVADDESVPVEKRRAQLADWRADVRRACENERPQFAVNRELQPVIARYRLSFALFDELIKGCEMDLDIKRYENFERLELYCYRVASVVGLLSIEIFGYQNPACRDYAISPRQGAAIHQHSARCPDRCRTRPDLSAAERTEKIQRQRG